MPAVMLFAAACAGIALILATLLDAFEVVLLPRPARHRLRLNHYFYFRTWAMWKWCASRWPEGRRREDFLGIYGPLSMVLLFSLWALCLIVGFGLVQWALQGALNDGQSLPLSQEMVMSGDAFFTLGYGDFVPRSVFSRVLVIFEAGTGFGFIALTVGYLPVLYQHFSTRDVQLIEFAARAGSPPTAAALLCWHAAKGDLQQLDDWLRDWEHWAGELIESHSTYPMLAFYRSQHDGHSWLATLAVVLDSCTLLIASTEGGRILQAAATFSAARRVLDEISQSLVVAPAPWTSTQRLEPQSLFQLTSLLKRVMGEWHEGGDTERVMMQLRRAYEPQLGGLSTYLQLRLPAWIDTSTETNYSTKAQLVKTLLQRIDKME
jgi:hypothetical protein